MSREKSAIYFQLSDYSGVDSREQGRNRRTVRTAEKAYHATNRRASQMPLLSRLTQGISRNNVFVCPNYFRVTSAPQSLVLLSVLPRPPLSSDLPAHWLW